MKIYTASSWKNESLVRVIAEGLRANGHDVYCFCEQGAGQHIFEWDNVVTHDDDGITCLDTDDSRRAFDVDKRGLDWAECCLLINPSGRDAHLEAGYAKGRGKLLIILGDWPKGEFSNMYHFADKLIRWDYNGFRYLLEYLLNTPGTSHAPGIELAPLVENRNLFNRHGMIMPGTWLMCPRCGYPNDTERTYCQSCSADLGEVEPTTVT